MSTTPNTGLIARFVQHRVAATVLMILVFFFGLWALMSLNTQFLPSFSLNIVNVRVAWPGASPQDVERALTLPLEEQLNNLDDVRNMTSVSSLGLSYVVIKFKQGVNMSDALAQVRNQVALVRNLPAQAERPIINRTPVYHPVARLVLTAPDNLSALRHYASELKRELIRRGVAKVNVEGLPDQRINIHLRPEEIRYLKKTLSQLGRDVNVGSEDVSAGIVGRMTGGRQLRAKEQRRDSRSFAQLPLFSGDTNLMMQLLHTASVTPGYGDYPELVYYQGKPAVSMQLLRSENQSVIASAKTLYRFLEEVKPTLPKGMQLHIYNELWRLVQGRIHILLKNGLGGLLLIFGLLFFFLNRRASIWVAMGIPIALSAALFALKLMGGTINMISLFALIMSLGIIVDDTIVVAEQSITEYQNGKSPTQAVIDGAQRMVVPIFTASLTTVAAFLPLLLLGGLFGKVLIAIPQVIICVILASLVECFLILPMHLKGALARSNGQGRGIRVSATQRWFEKVRMEYFRRFVKVAIHRYGVTLAIGFASFMLAMGVLAGGHINFNFFPSPPGQIINADVVFSSGTSLEKIKQQLQRVEQAAWAVDKQNKAQYGDVVKQVIVFTHKGTSRYEQRNRNRLGSVVIELSLPESREMTNKQFEREWKRQVALMPEVEEFRVKAPRGGPPGSDIDIGLSGDDPAVLKSAANELKQILSEYPGVYNISDNLPYAQAELVFSLLPQAKALGLTVAEVGRQLYSAYTGRLVELFTQDQDEVEVRIRLDPASRGSLASLENLPIVTAQGETLPLRSVVKLSSEQSFNSLKHLDGRLTVNVQAEVDPALSSAGKVLRSVNKTVLPQVLQRYGITSSQKGRTRDQRETLTQMRNAVFLSLGLIYLILAWVSSSYIWPLFVMLAIPLGLEGAIFGHLVMGRDLTLLSLFGFFGLTGIVINDSIILLFRYKELVEEGMARIEAVIEASCQRFRAVVLTSLTTIAGLIPLLFEQSRQAQFLIPMAISICFGLAFATALILIVIPAAIVAVESLRMRREKRRLLVKRG